MGVTASFLIGALLACSVIGRSEPYALDPERDTDLDQLTDVEEVEVYGTNPLVADTDGDSLLDGEEVFETNSDPRLQDTDGEGLNDPSEVLIETDPRNPDTDGDGATDLEELLLGTDRWFGMRWGSSGKGRSSRSSRARTGACATARRHKS